MIKADMWHEIHSRWKFKEKKRAIARALGMDVRTVRKVRVDIAQLGTGDVLQAQAIPGPALYPEAGPIIAQTLFARRLGVEIDKELVPGSKMLGVAISPGAVHFTVELLRADQI